MDETYILINGRRTNKRDLWRSGINSMGINQQIDNGVLMNIHYSYGCNQNIGIGNCYLCEEETLLYICGRHIIKYDIGKKQQQFITKMTDEEEVLSMSCSMNTKSVLSIAVAFKNKPHQKSFGMVRVYKSNRKQPYTCMHNELPLGIQVKQVALLQNAKYLLTISQIGLQMFISIFKCNKELMLAHKEVMDKITMIFGQVNFHSNFGMMGPRYMKLWDYSEDEKIFDEVDLLYQLLDDDEQFIYSVSLLKNEYFNAALTNYGELLLFKRSEQIQRIQILLSQNDINDALSKYGSIGIKSKRNISNKTSLRDIYDINQQAFPTIMAPYSNGICVGFLDINLIAAYELTKDGKLAFKKTHKFNVPNFHNIIFLHIGPDDSYLTMVVQHKSKQINSLYDERSISIHEEQADQSYDQNIKTQTNLNQEIESKRPKYTPSDLINNLEIYLFNFGIVDVINTALRDPFEYLFPQGVHKTAILNIEVSPAKSILLTLSEDRLVKLWEFGFNRGDFKCIYSITLHESPTCISLHPLAYQCAIGYREGLKFYFVLEDEIKQIHHENIRQCSAVKYSQGGNLLAVGSSNTIYIYSPYNYQFLFQLNGHNGQISQINWLSDDQILQSSCTQGLVLCFDIQNGQRVFDHSFKAYKSISSAYDDEYDLLIGSFTDQKIRIFNEKGMNIFYEMDVYPENITKIYIQKLLQIILFGTSNGIIRMYLWPFQNYQIKQQEYIEIALHQNPISLIQITPDLNYMLTGSDDGSIYVTKLREFRDGEEVENKDILSKDQDRVKFSVANLYSLNQLVFVSNFNQENKKDQIKELDFRISNLKTDIDDEKERITNQYTQKIKLIEDTNRAQIANQKQYLSNIMNDNDNRFRNLEDELISIRARHQNLLIQLEQDTSDALLQQYDRYDQLNLQYKNLNEYNTKQINQVKMDYKQILNDVDTDFNKKFGELFQRYSNAQENMKLDERKFKEVFSQSEKEFEILLKQTKKQLIEELDEKQRQSEQLRSSNTKFTKECERFTYRKAELQSLIKETQTQIDHLEIERKKFDGKNIEMSQQLYEKEQQINKKEQEIKSLRVKNNHLQNFRTVYDYRVNNLYDEKQPLTDHFDELDQNVKNMYKELIDESEANKTINQSYTETKDKIIQYKKLFQQKREALLRTRHNLVSLQYDILQTLKQPEITYFPDMFQKIHHEHFIEQKKKINQFTKIGNLRINYQENDHFLLEMEHNTQQAIKEELLRQRDFLSKKIVTVSRLNKQNEKDREDLILRVQNENTSLIKECNALREERKGLKEHNSNMSKAYDIINKELKSKFQKIDQNESVEMDSINYDEQSNFLKQSSATKIKQQQQLQYKQQEKKSAIIKSINPTGYQRYHLEQQDKQLKRYQLSQSLPKFNQVQNPVKLLNDNKNLLLNLLQEIQIFNSQVNDDGLDQVTNRLKEQVSEFIKQDDSQISLPIINQQQKNYNINQSQQQNSQEETGLLLGEVSGANTSIESKVKNSFQLKKTVTLPTLKKKI